jgi:Fe-S cluster biosynthesis and repair protein YggX
MSETWYRRTDEGGRRVFCIRLSRAIDGDDFEVCSVNFGECIVDLDAELDRRAWCLSWGGI